MNLLNDIPHSVVKLNKTDERLASKEREDPLPLAPVKDDILDVFEDQQEDLLREAEKHKLATRQWFSQIVEDLKKNYRVFARPVDRVQNPDYNPDNPMDLGTMEERIFSNEYQTTEDFMEDIQLIVHNAETFNDPNIPYQKDILLKVSVLRHLRNVS